MITKEQFALLGAGDVVEWNGRRERVVLSGPRDAGGKCITLEKVVTRDWAPGNTTTYNFHDVRRILVFTGRRRRAA